MGETIGRTAGIDDLFLHALPRREPGVRWGCDVVSFGASPRPSPLAVTVRVLAISNGQPHEDAMQQAYLQAYVHLGDFQGASSFSTWLTRVAINEALARLRKRARMKVRLHRARPSLRHALADTVGRPASSPWVSSGPRGRGKRRDLEAASHPRA